MRKILKATKGNLGGKKKEATVFTLIRARALIIYTRSEVGSNSIRALILKYLF